jgi:hypothetical protein
MSVLPAPSAANNPDTPPPGFNSAEPGPLQIDPDWLPHAGGPAGTLDPRQGVRDWEVTAVGRKPGYQLARDCLHASLLRNRLPGWYHRYVAHPPAWLADLTGHLPGPARAQAAQHLALHFLHLRRLALLAREVGLAGAGADAQETLERLWRCWPYGVGVRWRGEGVRTERDVCGRAWLCPWCFARRVVGLHARVLSGPLRHPAGVHLLQGRVQFSSEALAPDGGGGQARRVRDGFGSRLLGQARRLGVRGGVLTFRVGQDWGPDGHRFFLYELGVLGAVGLDAVAAHRGRLIAELDGEYAQAGGSDGAGLTDLWPAFETAVEGPEGEFPVCWALLPARPRADRDVARLLLAGTSVSYPLEDGLGVHTEGAPSFSFADGLPGVLGWQPTFLFDADEWLRYAAMTRGLPLARGFGPWRGLLGPEPSGPRAGGAARPRGRRRRRDGPAPLGRVNAARHAAAQGRRRGLLEVARPLWPEVLARCAGRRGRPPHRAVLGQLLAEHGHGVTERDLRYLVKDLVAAGERDPVVTGSRAPSGSGAEPRADGTTAGSRQGSLRRISGVDPGQEGIPKGVRGKVA